ncbi:hypothetical protein [Mucilaginibacter sp. HD30]
MKRLFLNLALIITTHLCFGQYSGSFNVQGDLNKFYPVIFQDLSWGNNKATEIEIGRSNVHTDASWRGSVIAKFSFHTTDWGHGSNFINAELNQFNGVSGPHIAGWSDATASNGDSQIIIWLKGGTTTYYFNSPVNISPVVYDGVQHALPFQQTNGPAHTYKTSVDYYVNSYGTNAATAYFTGGTNNYFAGNVGIGTTDPQGYKLAVNGPAVATSMKVKLQANWPDFVFRKEYELPTLTEVKTYIDKNQHLPDMPSAEEVHQNGLDLGEMNRLLLKKVEELTLYLMEEHNKNADQENRIKTLETVLKTTIQNH